MSRVGKKPIPVPDGVKVSMTGREVTVQSGQKQLTLTHRPDVSVRVDEASKTVVVERSDNSRLARALHGTTRSLIANMMAGVVKDFSKELEVTGVGWTAKMQGNRLSLNVGYADARELEVPQGLDVQVNRSRIRVSGPDKQQVGQFAADVRSQRPPEPYNAKGIKYIDERVVRKQGKAFAAGGAS